jgi:hypothetical protein
VIGAAVSSVSVLNASGSGPATVSLEGIEVAHDVAPGAIVRVRSSAVAAAIRKSVEVSGQRRSTSASVSVGSTVRRVELGVIDEDDLLLVVSDELSSSATVMKMKHDTAKNSVGNIRGMVVFGTTSRLETKACVALFPGDDTCLMGAAKVGSLAGNNGGAAAASYAATGRLLYPPRLPPAQGTSMRFVVEEIDTLARHFAWDSPAGLTPVGDRSSNGFAIVAAGTVVDATALDQRALLFVDTTVTPWTVQASLSR